MSIRHCVTVTTLALPIALVSCMSSDVATSQASESTTTNVTGGTTAPTSSGTGDTGETVPPPREPVPNSVFVTFVDPDGAPLRDGWIQRLTTDAGPDVPQGAVPGMAPVKQSAPLHANANGQILVEGLPPGEQQWMIGAPGHVTRTEVFSLADGTRSKATFRMTALGEPVVIDTAQPNELAHGDVKVHLPAGYMVKKRTGERVEGPVQARLTVVKPGPDNLDAAPVPLVGEGEDGQNSGLVSFGMVGVEFRSMEGELLELNDDVSAVVSIELTAEESKLVDELGITAIPAWHADPDKGEVVWQEVGAFLLSKQGDRYLATAHSIKRFSWINTDLKSKEPRCYNIKVVDDQLKPIVGKDLEIKWNGFPKKVFTDQQGSVCFELALGVNAKVTVVPAPPVDIVPDPNQPISVCDGNNLSMYKDYDKGTCKDILIEILSNDVCVPGSTWTCDDELPFPDLDMDGKPDDLDGKGICKAAQRTCADGTGWSECGGQVLPKPEECPKDQPVHFDENCNGKINEGCGCSPGEDQPCYTGNDSELNLPGSLCMSGNQLCDNNNEWGTCVDLPPALGKENCDPSDGIESCTADPCELADVWYHSMGKVGSHNAIASHLSDGKLTVLTQVWNGGDTASYGDCFTGALDKKMFEGITLAEFSTAEDTDPQNCEQANIIDGKIDASTVRADTGAKGAAVSGKVVKGYTVQPDLNSFIGACDKKVDGETTFVTRFTDANKCLYRAKATGAVEIVDVAVGTTADATFVALWLPAGQAGSLANCLFPVLAQGRAYYAKLTTNNMGDPVCQKTGFYPNEKPAVIDISKDGALAIAATKDDTAVYVRLLDSALVTVWEPADPIATFAAPSAMVPLGISSRNQKVAVIGHAKGTIMAFKTQQIDAGALDTDMVLLVSDPSQPAPDRGVSLRGYGGNGNPDKGDFGFVVEWVDYNDPDPPYLPWEGLLISGSTQSVDFVIGNCWTNQDPTNLNADIYNSFIGVLKYESGVPLDSKHCGRQYPMTGAGNQVLTQLAVEDMRVGLCGWHTGPIELNGKNVQDFTGSVRNAHCGLATLPVKP